MQKEIKQTGRYFLSVIIFSVFHAQLFAQSFVTVDSLPFPNVRDGASAWGDFDNDNDLDLLITGQTDQLIPVSKIFRNDSANQFTEINASLIGVYFSAADWGDFDNDGLLDILLTGRGPSSDLHTLVYRNNGDETFTDIEADFTPIQKGAAEWGDFDNDGDLDILISGAINSTDKATLIYRNEKEDGFTLFNPNIPGIEDGTATWGDYDNDGDLDILLTGSGISRVYRNDGGLSFVNILASLTGVVASSSAWADYDSDGDLDILLTGSFVAEVYRNDGLNIFTNIGIPFSKGVARSSVTWGDYDNDGDFDFTISGDNNSLARVTSLCRNDGGDVFTDVNAGLKGLWYSASACGDFDKDGTLDLLLTGEDSLFQASTILYRNTIGTPNDIPNTPTGLIANPLPHFAILSWSFATDTETPDTGLTYNIFVGTRDWFTKHVSPMSEIPDGYRRIAEMGSQQHNRVWTVKNLPKDTYYWGVQSVDNNYQGSPFAIDSFVICPNTNVHLGADTIMCFGDTLFLNGGIGLTGYLWSDSSANQLFAVTEPGLYAVTVTSADGCRAIDTIIVDYYPEMSIDAGEDVTINLNYNTQLNAFGGVQYVWTPTDSLSDFTIPDPVANPTFTTLYHVEVTDANNCSETDSVKVTVIREPPIHVPNFISPNWDNINDILVIDGIKSYPGNNFIIFNRWGDIVFETTDYQDDWDGTVEDTKLNFWGDEIPEATYFYKLLLNNGGAPITGYIVVKK